MTLTKERKIKKIVKLQSGQVWVVYPEQKNADGVIVCVLDVSGEIAQIVLLHNEKQLKTRIEPWITLDFCHQLRLIAVVERTLPVAMDAFQSDCYLGNISAEQLKQLAEAVAEFEGIILADANLSYLEANGHEEEITDELINKAFKKVLFLPICEDLEGLFQLHNQLQSVVQRHHEKLFFG